PDAEPVDVLMAPHHGSPAANTRSLAHWSQPRLVVVCDAQARRPRKDDPYAEIRAETWITGLEGAVTVHSGARGLTAESFRSGRRWVIPKGVIDEGKSATETALQEAWEEAGLLGVLGGAAGTYQYEKYGGTCLVTVFPMQVNEVRDDWPEAAARKRTWVGLDE